MAERNLNFDEIVERRGTDCLKYDFAKRRGKPADVLPLWVADMDFKTSSYVEDALIERAKHGIFGYSDTQEVYFNAVAFIFARIGGLHTVWFAFPIAEAFAIIFSGVCLVHVYRKEIIPLKAQQGK